MKPRASCITAMTLLTMLMCPPHLAAQENQDHTNNQHHHRRV